MSLDLGVGADPWEEADGIPAMYGPLSTQLDNIGKVFAPDLLPHHRHDIVFPERQADETDVRKKRAKIREESALRLIQEGKTARQVVREVAEVFQVSTRTATSDLARAREHLIRELSGNSNAIRADQYARYTALFSNPENPPGVRLGALERMDKLSGVEAPQKLQIGPAVDLERQRAIAALLPTEVLKAIESATRTVDGQRKAKPVRNQADDQPATEADSD